MSTVTPELLTQFVIKQGTVWQTVAMQLSEQNNVLVEIPTPTSQAVPITDLTLLTADPVLHAQIGFNEVSDEPSLIIVGDQMSERADTEKALIEALTGTPGETIDETILQLFKEFAGHLAQGLAIAFGNLRSTSFSPAEPESRHEPVTFPPNFLIVDEVIATRFTIQIPDRTPFTLTWLLTEGLARGLLGLQPVQDDPLASLLSEPEAPASAPTPTPMAYNPFAEADEPSERNLDLLLDIPLEVSVELGRVNLSVRDLLEIGTGSIIELHKTAGEPVEVLVNGKLVARGEVVVVEDNFAVRITEILSPAERVQKLGA
ncbi:MAG: flagellar motor switch protein FliN [Fimbriimonadales bacterium]